MIRYIFIIIAEILVACASLAYAGLALCALYLSKVGRFDLDQTVVVLIFMVMGCVMCGIGTYAMNNYRMEERQYI